MKRLLFFAVITPLVLIGSQDYTIWNGSISPEILEPAHEIGRFNMSYLSQEDTFLCFALTYGDIVVFSYSDDNYCEIRDSSGSLVAADTLMTDEYLFSRDVPDGSCLIAAHKPISVLSGDPFAQGLGCWYAVDEYSRPLSTKLLNVGAKIPPLGDRDAIHQIFAYQDNTYVTIRNLDTDEIVWEGILNDGEYYIHEQPDDFPQVFSIESSLPVNAKTACGVNGNYIPAFNGTFTGLEFYAYQHRWAGYTMHNMVTPWEDNTTVKMWPITADPEVDYPIEYIECSKRGDVTMFAIPERTAVYIRSDKPISLSQTQWSPPGQVFFYIVRGIDETGLGFGTEFFVPLQYSITSGNPPSVSRLNVIAYSDETDIRVSRIGRYDFQEQEELYTGILDKGEYYRYSCEQIYEHVAIYRVEASKRVSVIGSTRDQNGSDFLPVINAKALGILEPVTPEISVTPLIHLNSIGQQIVLKYSNHPGGFLANVFDASGRKVDELHSPGTQGILRWGEGFKAGVYFIKPSDTNVEEARKVVLVK